MVKYSLTAMHCTGVDIIEIERIQQAISRWGARFLDRIYTEAELRLCQERPPALAVRFAGKEAVMKALGTGVRGVSWKEIEILPDPLGKPLVYLYGKAQKRAASLGLDGLAISLSHSREYAVAFVVGELDGGKATL
ncbi:MAG: acpS [Dehalococcoidales bacterium]|nr:acpS [Dehalococcoidales bacterium]